MHFVIKMHFLTWLHMYKCALSLSPSPFRFFVIIKSKTNKSLMINILLVSQYLTHKAVTRVNPFFFSIYLTHFWSTKNSLLRILRSLSVLLSLFPCVIYIVWDKCRYLTQFNKEDVRRYFSRSRMEKTKLYIVSYTP